MYDEFAHLWTLISAPEDYAEEAGYWRNVLRTKLGPGRHDILELGVGGGNNLSHLTGDFQATAVDISERMLANSIRLNPGVEHHVGDMRTVRLGRTFRAVIIHDAVSYLLNDGDIRATFATAAAHLEPGGILVVAPDWYRESFPGTFVSSRIKRKNSKELTFVEYTYDPDPSDTTIETVYFYFMREQDGLHIEQDLHVNGLFPLQTWLQLMVEAGFEAEKWPYPVHEDSREAYLLAGTLK
jgi:hypothetical protein